MFENPVWGNSVDAYRKFAQDLKAASGIWYRMSPANMKRHAMFIPEQMEGRLPSFYAVYKREHFFTFGKYFGKYFLEHEAEFELEGKGQSLNKRWLEYAIRKQIDYIVFIMLTGERLMISTRFFYKYAKQHGLIRGQQKLTDYFDKTQPGSTKSVSETTYCIPIELLERWTPEKVRVS